MFVITVVSNIQLSVWTGVSEFLMPHLPEVLPLRLCKGISGGAAGGKPPDTSAFPPLRIQEALLW